MHGERGLLGTAGALAVSTLRHPDTLFRLLAAAVIGAVLASSASASSTTATGRQPPPFRLEFRGLIGPGGASGFSEIAILTFQGTAFWVGGALPGTCRRADGRVLKAGRDGDEFALFQGFTGAAPIADNGSFAFVLRKPAQPGGAAPFSVSVRGTFYGHNVVGRIKGWAGPDPLQGRCTGDAAFWAKRYRAG